MKTYPSIPSMKSHPKFLSKYENEPCLAFVKYDGSNIRCDWNKKSGWYKFGTRTCLLDPNQPDFGGAIGCFMSKYADSIVKTLRDHKDYRNTEALTAYCEYYGPNSFGKLQTPKDLGMDNPRDVTLFDVNIYKKCFMSPWEFRDIFSALPIAEVVYDGKLSEELVQDVRDGKYPVKEGVIIKGGSRHDFWMLKVKTNAYLTELKQRFENWQDFWE